MLLAQLLLDPCLRLPIPPLHHGGCRASVRPHPAIVRKGGTQIWTVIGLPLADRFAPGPPAGLEPAPNVENFFSLPTSWATVAWCASCVLLYFLFSDVFVVCVQFLPVFEVFFACLMAVRACTSSRFRCASLARAFWLFHPCSPSWPQDYIRLHLRLHAQFCRLLGDVISSPASVCAASLGGRTLPAPTACHGFSLCRF